MQLKSALVLASAAGASASALIDSIMLMPQCAVFCYAASAYQVDCDPTDLKCGCQTDKVQGILSVGEVCVTASCGNSVDLGFAGASIALVCDSVNNGSPSDDDFSQASSIISQAVAVATSTFVPTATPDPTTIAATTITTGSVTKTVSAVTISTVSIKATAASGKGPSGTSSAAASSTSKKSDAGHLQAGLAAAGGLAAAILAL